MTDPVALALAGSAAAALGAPPLTRPASLRLVVRSDALEFYGGGGSPHDPQGRLALLNCGTALHHARIALAEAGLVADVRLRPDDEPDHVARLTAAAPAASGAEPAQTPAQTPAHTPTRTPTAAPAGPGAAPVAAALTRIDSPRPSPALLAKLVRTAQAQGIQMRVLSEPEVVALASAARSALPAGPARARATGHQRTHLLRPDRSAEFAVLYGDRGRVEDWVRAGEAYSALRLEADRHGVRVSGSLAAIEPPRAGRLIRRLVGPATAYLAIRIDGRTPLAGDAR
jgi:hypothetical protein